MRARFRQPRLRSTQALLTDMYQITMSYAYWRAGRHEEHVSENHDTERLLAGARGGYIVSVGCFAARDAWVCRIREIALSVATIFIKYYTSTAAYKYL